jgi:hypothetical protein
MNSQKDFKEDRVRRCDGAFDTSIASHVQPALEDSSNRLMYNDRYAIEE